MPRGSASAASKSKKVSSAPAHPKYADMIKAIKKYILNTYNLPDNPTTNSRLRMAITKGCEKGIFSFPNGPSGTLKLVKKEKEKKEVEKKDKPVAKKIEKSVPKTTTKRAAPTKRTTEKASTGALPPKKAAPKAKKATTAKESTSSTRKAKPAATTSTSKRAAANKRKTT
ncbi:10371_t:CDS:2 [Entrophospora sp. SA101]|nr:14009_t:CDS:2 [Entrophospora sp. SA101]CAJ0825482.1 12188_t:CDS:2 [Entrophospora sp. SA101]CAJ0838743.1 10371_t:CDS:2 [Entrophospora sp. SA101]CAJ0918966.1 16368_t:CDS:2 [Entrophospora sp. SA101]CAJ0918980.1 16376_t:CDS:2 [Entrophospora sp. SA101]